MDKPFRITKPTLRVLAYLLTKPGGEVYGLEVSEATGLKYGTVQPILVRLEQHKWAESEWEDIDPKVEGRRARRYYKLTAEGIRKGRREIEAVRSFLPAPLGFVLKGLMR